MKRGTIRRDSAIPVTLWVPKTWIPKLTDAVRTQDTDKSKFVRAAIKEKLARIGIAVEV